jgi:hypothetical protein
LLVALALALALAQWPCDASARFAHGDAERIDREEGLRSEAMLDKLSYRPTWRLRERWRRHLVGYQTGAGSMDAAFFHHYEDIRIGTDPMQEVAVGFERRRREDVLEVRADDELRIGWRPAAAAYQLALLGDGGTNKKWDDLGIALAAWPSPFRRLEAYAFSVDHYYADKEVDNPDDEYARRPWSAGWRGAWQTSGGAWLEGDVGYDAPTRWQRRSHGYTYDYARRRARLSTETPPLGGGWTLSGRVEAEDKYEQKSWYATTVDEAATKTMRRYALELGLEGRHTAEPDRYQELGMLFVRRDASYRNVNLERAGVREQPSPTSRRRELLGFALQNQTVDEAHRHHFEWGLFASRVAVEREFAAFGFGAERAFDNFEVKFHTAWEYILGPQGSLVLGLNYNVDRIVADFPYTEHPFRPWNGGNLQFQAVF